MREDLWEESSDVSGSFASRLESRARRLTQEGETVPGDRAIERMLEHELALVLDQIEERRDLHARQLRSLVRVECYVDTELMQMEQRTPRYSPQRFPEREKLQRRLGSLESERRNLASEQAKELAKLHDRLLVALNRRDQLVP